MFGWELDHGELLDDRMHVLRRYAIGGRVVLPGVLHGFLHPPALHGQGGLGCRRDGLDFLLSGLELFPRIVQLGRSALQATSLPRGLAQGFHNPQPSVVMPRAAQRYV